MFDATDKIISFFLIIIKRMKPNPLSNRAVQRKSNTQAILARQNRARLQALLSWVGRVRSASDRRHFSNGIQLRKLLPPYLSLILFSPGM